MQWSEKCLLELTHHNMFENSEHRLRFRDLINCYYQAPFFTKGLCKCMYLACWDDEHFTIMLDMLNDLTINGSKNLRMMREQGFHMEQTATPEEKAIMNLSNSFISGSVFNVPDFDTMDPEVAHIIRRGMTASIYIDDLPDPQSGKPISMRRLI